MDHTGLEEGTQIIGTLQNRLRAVIRGRDDVIDLILVALLADGHVLLEDYPGSGKTTLARALGESIEGEWGCVCRVSEDSIYPDLLPSDITGTNVFDVERGDFSFREGRFSPILFSLTKSTGRRPRYKQQC